MDQDKDLDSVPLVEKEMAGDDMLGVGEEATRWDLFVLTAPFLGWVNRFFSVKTVWFALIES